MMLAEIHARRTGRASARTVLGRRGWGAAQIVPEVMSSQCSRGRQCRRRDAAAAAAQLEWLQLQLRRRQLIGMPQTDLRMRRCGRRCRSVVQMMMMQMRLRLGLDVQLLLQQESCSWRRRRRWLLGRQCGTAYGGGTAGRRALRRASQVGGQMSVWQVTCCCCGRCCRCQLLLLLFPLPFALLLLVIGGGSGKQLGMQRRQQLLHARREEIRLE